MKLIFQDNGKHREHWLAALTQALPEANIRVWQAGDQAPADYAIVWNPDPAMLQGRHDLKAIFSRGAGVDAILKLGDSLPAGVPIIRLVDVGMGIQMAEYIVHAVLRYFRRLDQYELQARQHRWQPLPAQNKQDFTIGVLGSGVLGQQVMRAILPFGFPVQCWSRNTKEIEGVRSYAGPHELDAFLQSSKVLVCMLPLTEDTENILNRQRLSQLPTGSYVINVARGAHVVDADLLELIQQGHLAGATLDVFRQEPLPAEHPFWQEPRITLTPHIAALTLIDESAAQIGRNIEALEHGEHVDGVIDPQRGY